MTTQIKYGRINLTDSHNPSVNQNLVIENRRRAVISGVKEVEGFTETEIRLYTEMGQISVKGKRLQVVEVSTQTGELIMTGEPIDSLSYSDKTKRTPDNFITKIFR